MSYEIQDSDKPYQRLKTAKGHLGKGKSPRVVISFDPHAFFLIAIEANKRKISFASVVRELVDVGLCKQHWDKKELERSADRWLAAYGVGQRQRTDNGSERI